MSETSENPVQNKVVTQRINQAIAGVYKPGGTKTVAQLNALTKDASLNGYVYNVGDSGTLYDGLGGDIEVRTGDNVCLIYHDSENWYWYNMVGSIGSGLFKHEVTLSDGTNSYKLMIINNNSSQFSTSTGMAWNGVFDSCLKMLYYDSVSANWYLVTYLNYVNSYLYVQFFTGTLFDSVSIGGTINSINDSVSPY
jgi:hypothetical protein